MAKDKTSYENIFYSVASNIEVVNYNWSIRFLVQFYFIPIHQPKTISPTLSKGRVVYYKILIPKSFLKMHYFKGFDKHKISWENKMQHKREASEVLVHCFIKIV